MISLICGIKKDKLIAVSSRRELPETKEMLFKEYKISVRREEFKNTAIGHEYNMVTLVDNKILCSHQQNEKHVREYMLISST